MIRVSVVSKTLHNVRPYQNKNYGEQSAAMHTGTDFPTPIKLNVQQGNEYDPGDYTFDPQSYIADEMGNPKLKRIKLLPLGGVVKK
jgi:hypothetical protein